MSKEINLLPLSRRRRLARRFMERQLTVFFRSLTWALTIVTVGGVGAIVFLQIGGSVLFDPVDGALEKAVVDFRVEARSIAAQNRLVQEMVDKQEARLTWSDFFSDVLGTLPAGTTLYEVKGVIDKRQIELRGVAVARSALVVMEERLRALPWAAGVEAPHSNLLERDNPPFTFFVQL